MMSYTETQRREAAEWFVSMREAQEPAETALHEWLSWMERSPGNRLAS